MTSFAGGPFQRWQLRITDLSSEQLATLTSDPPVFVPAPGPGLANVVLSAYNLVTPGSSPFLPGSVFSSMGYEGEMAGLLNTPMVLGGPSVILDGHLADAWSMTLFENTAIVAQGPSDDIADGSILTSSLNVGGADYVPDDTFTVDGGTGSSGVVVTVDGGGAVLTYTITDGGSGYVETVGATTTATTGIGTGLTIDILTVTPATGTARVYVYYSVLELP